MPELLPERARVNPETLAANHKHLRIALPRRHLPLALFKLHPLLPPMLHMHPVALKLHLVLPIVAVPVPLHGPLGGRFMSFRVSYIFLS